MNAVDILLLPYGVTSIFHNLQLKTHDNNPHSSKKLM
jgi:hypothetical protein